MCHIHTIHTCIIAPQVHNPGQIDMVRIEIMINYNSSNSSNSSGNNSSDSGSAAWDGGSSSSSLPVALVRTSAAGWFYTWDPNITSTDLSTFNVNR